MAWKRYRTPEGAHVTLNYTAEGLIELPAEPALDVNGRPRQPPTRNTSSANLRSPKPPPKTSRRCHEFHRH